MNAPSPSMTDASLCAECPCAVNSLGITPVGAIPENAKARQIAFFMNDRATGEAYSLAFEVCGYKSITLDASQLDGIVDWNHLSVSLFVMDPEIISSKTTLLLSNLKLRKIPIFFLTSVVKPAHILQALKYQTRGLATSENSLSTLVTRISQIVSGESFEYWCTKSEQMIERNGPKKKLKADSVFTLLTPRQLEVLTYLAEGKTVKEVAQVMHLSQKSVDSHKYRIMNRLHIHDRVHLSRLAIREGLIDP